MRVDIHTFWYINILMFLAGIMWGLSDKSIILLSGMFLAIFVIGYCGDVLLFLKDIPINERRKLYLKANGREVGLLFAGLIIGKTWLLIQNI